jgi:hypothetical protein
MLLLLLNLALFVIPEPFTGWLARIVLTAHDNFPAPGGYEGPMVKFADSNQAILTPRLVLKLGARWTSDYRRLQSLVISVCMVATHHGKRSSENTNKPGTNSFGVQKTAHVGVAQGTIGIGGYIGRGS